MHNALLHLATGVVVVLKTRFGQLLAQGSVLVLDALESGGGGDVIVRVVRVLALEGVHLQLELGLEAVVVVLYSLQVGISWVQSLLLDGLEHGEAIHDRDAQQVAT